MKNLTPFIIIAISLGMYFLYVSPTMADIRLLSAKKSEYTNVLLKSKELAQKRDSMLSAYNSIREEDESRLSKVIPTTFDQVRLVNDINAMANRYGMKVLDFKVEESKAEIRSDIISQSKEELYKTIAVTFTTNGQYIEFIRFLRDLESSLRLIDVGSLSIKTDGGKSSGAHSLDYSIQIYTYSLR